MKTRARAGRIEARAKSGIKVGCFRTNARKWSAVLEVSTRGSAATDVISERRKKKKKKGRGGEGGGRRRRRSLAFVAAVPW